VNPGFGFGVPLNASVCGPPNLSYPLQPMQLPLHTTDDLVPLDPDHPGFRDAGYRERRNAIARVALDYAGGPVPEVPYAPSEQGVWRTVWEHLGPLHDSLACRAYREVAGTLALPRDRIPQLSELNPKLQAASGFRMLPVGGLVAASVFLRRLAEGVFLSTQYIRHSSSPLYTPEPDVVHELVGHAATLTHPQIAALSRTMGRAALETDDAGVAALERVYWYTLEFGVVEEDGDLRAFGAGVLSSSGELERFREGTHLPWNLERMAATPYDPTAYQPGYFVAPSTEDLLADVEAWCRGRFGAAAREG
jgi:phenylalanine-4-hydroxylase